MEANSFDIDFRRVNANIAQIQVLAAVVRKMVQDEYHDGNSHLLVSLPLPRDYSDWNALNNYCKTQNNAICFKILSELFGSSSYICNSGDHSQPRADVYLQLSVLQDAFAQLENLKLETSSETDICKITQQLTTSYMFLNNGIGDFFYNLVYENGTFDWSYKLHPDYINLDWLRELNGSGIFVADSENKRRLQKVFKTRLEEFACQCRFMAFWTCLLQIVTCPSLPKAMRSSFRDFASCLLHNFGSVYVHHIIVEQSSLNQSIIPKYRGSSDNTTRLKVYFTLENGHPLLARFDLSHKGVPFLHINMEDENGAVPEFNHCQLSLTEAEDNILKPLEDALMTFNYNGVEFKHAPTHFDKKMLHRITVERALFGACSVEWSTAILSDIYKKEGLGPYDWDKEHSGQLSTETQSYIRECRTILEYEVESYGFDPQEIDHTEIFECIYDEIFK
ncbi:hypothetical protein [Bacteroides graminisolvens]|uniref:hypothetical protein n=1 Tax=Bacteroides graminisolvens TaxID=477666 RepID=UPI0029C66BE0|nr:hypothetical protein [Bacteroides graminisolvens]